MHDQTRETSCERRPRDQSRLSSFTRNEIGIIGDQGDNGFSVHFLLIAIRCHPCPGAFPTPSIGIKIPKANGITLGIDYTVNTDGLMEYRDSLFPDKAKAVQLCCS